MGASNITEGLNVNKDFRIICYAKQDLVTGCFSIECDVCVFFDNKGESLYSAFPLSDLEKYITEGNGELITASVCRLPFVSYCGMASFKPVFSDFCDDPKLIGFVLGNMEVM